MGVTEGGIHHASGGEDHHEVGYEGPWQEEGEGEVGGEEGRTLVLLAAGPGVVAWHVAVEERVAHDLADP